MQSFEILTAGRILFGAGCAARLPEFAAQIGRRPMYIRGSRRACSADFVVPSEPSVHLVREGVARARSGAFDCVVAMGGGSVLDAGKAIAVLAANEGDPLDYLEIIGKGQPIRKPGLPCIAVPTTSGTGSEVTRNAVLVSPEHKLKVSLRDPFLLPRVAVVDPELTMDVPPFVTASTGLDALTQLIEPYLSVKANAFTDALCLDGIAHAARSLRRAYSSGEDRQARADMSYAALLGGLTLANAGLGVVHGFAAPIGGMFTAPHGAVCAALLPHGVRANLDAVRMRAPERLGRFAVIARVLTGDPAAQPGDCVLYLERLCADLQIPGLARYGVEAAHVPELVEKAGKASSMKANPVLLTADELTTVLTAAL